MSSTPATHGSIQEQRAPSRPIASRATSRSRKNAATSTSRTSAARQSLVRAFVMGRAARDANDGLENENVFVSESPKLQKLLQRARQAARTDMDVLVEAESGAGKELLARLIHQASGRRNRGPSRDCPHRPRLLARARRRRTCARPPSPIPVGPLPRGRHGSRPSLPPAGQST